MASNIFHLSMFVAFASAQTNPIKVNSAVFKGYRNSTNTQGLRDLGFMGNIGSTYILSFGDGVGAYDRSAFNPSAPVGEKPDGTCAYITARDGGGIQGNDPLAYQDIGVVYNSGGCGNIPEMGYFVPKLPGEEDSQGLGITNVVAVNSSYGCIWTRPTVSGSDFSSSGAGLAVVQLGAGPNGLPKATRPFGKSTWSQNEPDWGQLSAIDGRDGYTYVYANSYNDSKENNNVVLARAPTAEVFNLNSYTYWHGSKVGFTHDRIYISSLSSSSPENLVGFNNDVGQGTASWSTYYKKWIYICQGVGFDNRNTYMWTADAPQGPWSPKILAYTDQQGGPSGYDYGGYIMPKFSSADGKTIYYSYTRAAYFEAVVQVTFA